MHEAPPQNRIIAKTSLFVSARSKKCHSLGQKYNRCFQFLHVGSHFGLPIAHSLLYFRVWEPPSARPCKLVEGDMQADFIPIMIGAPRGPKTSSKNHNIRFSQHGGMFGTPFFVHI